MVIVLGMALLFALGCAQRPTDRIVASGEIVAKARTGAAALYSVEDVRRLEGLLATLTEAVQEQDSRLSIMRDYGHVDLLAGTLLQDAQRVILEAADKRDAAKASAVSALQEAREALAESRRLIAAAAKSRRGLSGIRGPARDTETLGESINSVQRAIDDEDYWAAEARAQAITAKAEGLSGHIQSIAARIEETPGTRIAQN
jgi:hypothetical protein